MRSTSKGSRCFYLCFLFVFYGASSSFGFNLTIIHTNDIHAHIEQMNKYASDCKQKDVDAGLCYGGVARRFTKVNEIRKADPDHTLLLDAGDEYQGTLWFNIYKGWEASHFMNQFGYDAMTFGNHEFDNGVDGLLPFIDNVTFPLISCNMDVSKEPKLQGKFNKSIVVQKGGRKIGLIGYITEETGILSNAGDTIEFTDAHAAIREEVRKMKSEGVDIIIGVGHYGYGEDMKLAKDVDGLDVLVGGHTHSFLYGAADTKGPLNDTSEGQYPTTIIRPDGKPCLIVQAYFAGLYLGRLNVEFDDDGDVKSWSGLPILLDDSVKQDENILAQVNEMQVPLQEEKNKVVGYSAVYLEGSNTVCRVRECNLGNLITDAMVAYHVKSYEENQAWTASAIAILNSGGIRAPIEAGNITMGDVLTTQPFGNNVDIITTTGATLRKALEHAVAKYSRINRPGAFLQVSGLRVTYDLCKPPGSRVVSVYTRCRRCRIPTYNALDDAKKYFVVTLDFVIRGGDGYSVIKDNLISHNRNNDRDSDVTAEYISNSGPITIGEEGRTTLLGDENCYVNTAPKQTTKHLFVNISLIIIIMFSFL